ncbi:MAG: NAD-dependent epimerase/dehydratase family protein [Proteobacteria bacterium]|jgi:nucleoside-diphosphate-sugar epimerase|nr:NAD-dependent epimerase/dehydratase family protein [Desulfocapsa sp.]MBU3944216.1 NAD-dependent epimerase/dehydratase family protein [Pseudomonadota bacterium]MCG2743805.1 NAD-dependent epimerase/dehydratase family protein [Desulfobacteraceae bacterium]MBU3982124.1 NAD-dependent epimerase/dehydratase family protein [Pseudomonadota bacterium]MBU4028817.1 NAD-dependent epimerase/dehydratase family protein [Pseudomonadota bacterium]
MNKALITGGGGFVGKAIVRQLLAHGVQCLVVGRHAYPELESLGVTCRQGDIIDCGFIRECCQGVDTVFHVAALAGIWGRWRDYYATNVLGTENVLAGCRAEGVRHLVYTSTPSVVFNQHSICNGDEKLPYADHFLCHYARSKVMAEQLVLAESDYDLHTCAIRPHLVWGPGDPHLIPRLIDRGRKGQLRRVGDGQNLVDISYIDNVAHAHLLAADNLAGVGTASGRAYCISQGEPMNLWQWINELFSRLDIAPIRSKISYPVAYGLGALLEWGYRLSGCQREPQMTRFLAQQLAKSHYFSIAQARRDLGYQPIVSTEEGMERLLASLMKK